MTDNKESKDLLQKLDKIITETLVPRFSNETVRPCEEKDFRGYTEKLENNLQAISEHLDLLIEVNNIYLDNIFKIIIVIGEQHSENPWNIPRAVNMAKSLVPKVCHIYECKSIEDLLNNDQVLMQIIMFLRPKLLKNTWKSFPSSVVCYKWLLEFIQVHTLSKFLADILPTALIIFDDYVEQNQIIGLYCINKITTVCLNSTVLQEYNYHQVIFDALMKETHKVKTNMIVPLYNCISNILLIIERSRRMERNTFGWTKRDIVLGILLDNMELQSDHNCRSVYITCLKEILNHSGLGKWSVRLSRVLSEYCEDDSDLEMSEASVDVIKQFLGLYQPKDIKVYTTLYNSLLVLRYKLITNTNATKKFIENVDDCISLLNRLCPNTIKILKENEVLKTLIKAE